MHLDNLLEQLKPYGPFQILSWLVLSSYTCFPAAWHQFAITFTAYFPSNYGCYNDGNQSLIPSKNGNNLSYSRLPLPNRPCEYTLEVYSLNNESFSLVASSNETCSPDEFWYSQDDPVTSTIITQWNLVCSREYLLIIISAAEGVGEVLGCIVFGYIGDRFGRKFGFFFSAAFLFASGLLCALAPHPVVAVIARLLIGVSLTGMNNIGFLMNAELFTASTRTIFSTGGEMLWSLAVVSLAGIGYLVRDAFWFMMAITLPIILMTPFWWFLNESLHWNISKGRIDAAKASLRRIARFNKVELDEELMQQVLEKIVEEEGTNARDRNQSHTRSSSVKSKSSSTAEKLQSLLPPAESAVADADITITAARKPSLVSQVLADKQESTVLDLFRTPRLRTITILLTLLWLANTLSYYGLQLAAQLIEGVDFYLSFFILAIVEVPSIFAVVPVMVWLGRRWTIIVFQTLAGACCVVVPFVHLIPTGSSEIIRMSIAAFGKFAVCSSFTALYVYAVELFPTTLRATGFGVVSVVGRIGMIIAPLLNSLGFGESSSSVPVWVRMVIYGVVLIGTGFLTFPLPETNQQPLAETVEDMENYLEYCKNYHQVKLGNKVKLYDEQQQQKS